MNKGHLHSRLLLTILFLFSTVNLNSMHVSLIDIKNTIESCLIKNETPLDQEKEFLIWEQIVYFGSKLKTNKKFINSEKAINFIIIVVEEELENKLSIENIDLIKTLIYGDDYIDSKEFSNDEYKQPVSPKTKRSTRGEYKDYPGTPRARRKDKNFNYQRKCKTPKYKKNW